MSHDGSKVSILYNGSLSSGSGEIYLHFGFGEKNNWVKVADHPMQKTPGGWLANVNMMGTRQLNFCFKDSADNWDNNSGRNWSYLINC
ncbi:MAG: hypothetical protein K6T80_05290 [Firmicutes bacterium]|nr:hypothetical protein [Bacillota bacterium]